MTFPELSLTFRMTTSIGMQHVIFHITHLNQIRFLTECEAFLSYVENSNWHSILGSVAFLSFKNGFERIWRNKRYLGFILFLLIMLLLTSRVGHTTCFRSYSLQKRYIWWLYIHVLKISPLIQSVVISIMSFEKITLVL